MLDSFIHMAASKTVVSGVCTYLDVGQLHPVIYEHELGYSHTSAITCGLAALQLLSTKYGVPT